MAEKKDCLFRLLEADEIEVRVAMVKDNGVSLLLYKNARCDQAILDETVGEMNWKNSYSRDNANCTIEIWDKEKAQWISKENTGTESYTEKEKGLASDSFKRAGFNWGIGRELYTAPFIWINKADLGDKLKGGKCFEKFSVSDIEYNDKRRIVSVSILIESSGKVVKFTNAKECRQKTAKSVVEGEMSDMNKAYDAVKTYPTEKTVNKTITKARAKQIGILADKMGLNKELYLASKGKTSFEELTESEAVVIENKAKDMNIES